MAIYNKFQQFVEDLAHQVHDLSADTLKIMLVNSPAPVATNEVKANLTEISAGNGYTAGGTQATISSSGHTTGTYKLVLADVTFTATASSIGPFRYPVLFNDTPLAPAGPLIAWWDYGSSISLADTETFTWDADATSGILQIA